MNSVRLIFVVMTAVLLTLHYRLWVSETGMREVWRLRHAVVEQETKNLALRERNEKLEAEVRNLKEGIDAAEERARNELGMIRRDETFYQVIRPVKDSGEAANTSGVSVPPANDAAELAQSTAARDPTRD